jgi:L-2-hydroxyglutarate oxidase LhgO
MNDQVDCVVIGAGVIGLATGRALAEAGRQVIVIERNAGIGEETSSRNSEVIHAGLYYPTGSLKATLCTRGKAALYDYCVRRQVPHRRSGKLIVAADDSSRPRLRQIAQQARLNGVDDLVEVHRNHMGKYEPAIDAAAALWSPSTGIIDSHALMLALQGDLEAADGIVATQTTVSAIAVDADRVRLNISSASDDSELTAHTVINAAGLGAAALAADCTGTEGFSVPKTWLARGIYFSYAGPSPFNSLVYPLPADGGLGIHATLDLAGGLRFGPDVEWIDRIDYTVDAGRRAAFAQAIRTYWPDLDESALAPAYAGIRPKLAGPGEPAADFRFDVVAAGPARQLIHLLGMESPGLTSALAIAEEVCRRLKEVG